MKTATVKDKMHARLEGFRLAAAAFRDDIKGVAAIEFAFIAPLMLLLYVGTIEISGALSANRKLSRVSSTLGDLLTQAECFTDPVLNDIIKIADDIMYPYSNSLKIRLTGILIDNGTRRYNGGAATACRLLQRDRSTTYPTRSRSMATF
ncbi:TadE/TadG family type IV pilus assembly protein [Salaquimonas pukyongi]|uniref:TadE/TadG family type IV pilus assembly protein n=1 Tax=Salaquimonas pukyongi TaxID=2712698 RepID=UPI00096B7B61|nr:TadE/TadG family type IV pilus assembly protein [Salaquimonas pukyongi]